MTSPAAWPPARRRSAASPRWRRSRAWSSLLPAALLVPGHVSGAALGFGAVAGVGGMRRAAALHAGLAVGPMGVVAPLSAVVGAGLPLVAGVLGGERPGAVGLAGARPSPSSRSCWRARAAAATPRPVPGCCTALGAGVGFGLFFVALDLTPRRLGAVAAARRPGGVGDAAGRSCS